MRAKLIVPVGLVACLMATFLWTSSPAKSDAEVKPERHVESTTTHRELFKLSNGSLIETISVTHTSTNP